MKEVGLYIHIPFCKQKCLYCDFNSYVCNDTAIEEYMQTLIKEIKLYQAEHKYRYKTVFIGGGTPTFINYTHIGAIMKEIKPYIAAAAEITIECNPGTVNFESLKSYHAMGINRLSIGLQAWQKEMQLKLGRIHDTKQFLQNLEQARRVGFDNISADLMFALPEQSMEMWIETVENAAQLRLKHISCYSLKLEEGTPFYKLYEQKKLFLPDDELDRAMYHKAEEILQKHGLYQYEISNFAMPDYECKHNLIYWKNEEYIGVGAGSHSKLDHTRYSNHKNLKSYIKSINQGDYPIEERNFIAETEEMWETIILELRLNKGLDTQSFKEKYSVDFMQIYDKPLQKLLKLELIMYTDKGIALTALGRDLSNSVFVEFLE